MTGIFLRDFYVFSGRHLKKPLILLLLLGIAGSAAVGFSVSGLIGIVLPMTIGALVSDVFTDGEEKNRRYFIKTLLVEAEKIVIEKYLFSTAVVLSVTAYCILLNLLSYFFYREHSPALCYILPLIGFVVAFINSLIMIPFCFKFGKQGANTAALCILFFVGCLTYGLQRMDPEKLSDLSRIKPGTALPVIIGILLMTGIISFILSVRFFKDKKE